MALTNENGMGFSMPVAPAYAGYGMPYGGGMSTARGRGDNTRRDSMGRYSRAEAEDAMMEALEDYMETVTDPNRKREVERFMDKMGR